jgi:hypothetical protein
MMCSGRRPPDWSITPELARALALKPRAEDFV